MQGGKFGKGYRQSHAIGFRLISWTASSNSSWHVNLSLSRTKPLVVETHSTLVVKGGAETAWATPRIRFHRPPHSIPFTLSSLLAPAGVFQWHGTGDPMRR